MIRICIPNAKASRNRSLDCIHFQLFRTRSGHITKKGFQCLVLFCLLRRDILRKKTIETCLCVQDCWGNSSNSQVRKIYTFFFGQILYISNVIGN